ncbi:MAG: cyclic nucleotide-binding domain-containing protein, partial [Clostridia bacterium]|nr:cyclic nucleotide-binding domain-containing protein [Clostridia bacterium]
MKKYFEVLRKSLLFSGLEDDELTALLSCLRADVLTFERRNSIFFEGERGRFIYIVLYGKIQLEMNDYYGNRSIISTHGPSELFAEEFACAGTLSMPVSAIASEESGVMLIPSERILHTCERGCSYHRQVIYNL